jgi:2-polyprenyl-3-methyl-5-hydroxy-6-metoxy-1,4-benzoquinol methylase
MSQVKNRDYFQAIFNHVNGYLGLSGERLTGRALDLGCGDGTFMAVCRSNGLEAFGVTPRLEETQIARSIGEGGALVMAVGEFLPFRDQSFDTITCMSVLEHVMEPVSVLAESVRCLKNGGIMYIYTADYSRCFHEGHFDIAWVPMPKRIARLYLRARGKDVSYLDTLQFVTKRQIVDILLHNNVQVVDLHALRSASKHSTTYLREKIANPEGIQGSAPRAAIVLLLRFGLSEKLVLAIARSVYQPFSRIFRASSVNLLVRKSGLNVRG